MTWGATDYDFDNEEILMTASDNYDLNAGGVKFDAGKVRMDLVPFDAVFAAAAVFTYGAIKYDDWNWAKGMRKGRLVSALLRHTGAYMMGEELDDESGLPHTWHMLACVMMLVSGELRGVAIEDRAMHVQAYETARVLFSNVKDPAGTEKNAGGTIAEEPNLYDNAEEFLQKEWAAWDTGINDETVVGVFHSTRGEVEFDEAYGTDEDEVLDDWQWMQEIDPEDWVPGMVVYCDTFRPDVASYFLVHPEMHFDYRKIADIFETEERVEAGHSWTNSVDVWRCKMRDHRFHYIGRYSTDL